MRLAFLVVQPAVYVMHDSIATKRHIWMMNAWSRLQTYECLIKLSRPSLDLVPGGAPV